MSLPKTPIPSTFLKKKNIESIVLPLAILAVFLGILFIGAILPKPKPTSKSTTKTTNVTKPTTITSVGKSITVPPEVKQVSPEQAKSYLESGNFQAIHVSDGDDFSEPHLKNSLFVFAKKPVTSIGDLNPEKNYIFVSSDGILAANTLAKLISLGLARDKSFNLEGGLEAWEKKGYPVEK